MKTLSELTRETPIGGTFEYEGEIVEVKSDFTLDSCEICCFKGKLCWTNNICCLSYERVDDRIAYFVKLEKTNS
jgi:hypothetical protein